uniref:Uncharacterized protein n=1 Tax=Musa acuminata subsp. malaccensis TaxID=214687 RepID=A0A804IUS3_MUSAM
MSLWFLFLMIKSRFQLIGSFHVTAANKVSDLQSELSTSGII